MMSSVLCIVDYSMQRLNPIKSYNIISTESLASHCQSNNLLIKLA